MLSALFLMIRVLVVQSAIDHLHNVARGEYQLAVGAEALLHGQSVSVKWNHLWAQPATAWFIAQMHRAGLRYTTALKVLPLALSFLGFAALLAAIFRRAGPWPAAIFGLLISVPAPNFLKWTLMTWGGYPEAAAMTAVAVGLWISAVGGERKGLLFAAGMATGLSLAYSMSVLGVALAVFVVTPLAALPGRRLRTWLLVSAGMAAGLSPLIVWLAGGAWSVTYKAKVVGVPGARIFASVTWPSWANLFAVIRHQTRSGNVMYLFTLATTTIWAFVSAVKKGGRRELLVFPVSIAAATLAIACYPFSERLETRHLLWFYVAFYSCLSVMIGDVVGSWIPNRIRKWETFRVSAHARVDTGFGVLSRLVIMRLGVAVLILAQLGFTPFVAAAQTRYLTPLIQFAEMDMLQRFHGMTYFRHGVGTIYGKMADRANCLFCQNFAPLNDWEFKRGLMRVLDQKGMYECCTMEPILLELKKLIIPPDSRDPCAYCRGAGCGIAIQGRERLADAGPGKLSPEMLACVAEGFNACANLKCPSIQMCPDD